MLFAFCWLKMEEKKDRHYRKTLTLREILLMAIPSICNSISGSLYYVLQRMLNDELTIHVFLFIWIKCSPSHPFKLSL